MDKNTLQDNVTARLTSSELSAKLVSHLEEKTDNIRDAHRIMQVLEMIFFSVMLLVFLTALVLSFLSKSIPTQAIPTAWFLLPTSAAVLTALIGIHAIIINAFPPSGFLSIFKNGSPMRLPAQPQGFVTGSQARGTAWAMLLVGLIAGAFFGVFAWASWTTNWTLLAPMIKVLGIILGVGIAASILIKMAYSVVKTAKR